MTFARMDRMVTKYRKIISPTNATIKAVVPMTKLCLLLPF
jgi:hypothetical protein